MLAVLATAGLLAGCGSGPSAAPRSTTTSTKASTTTSTPASAAEWTTYGGSTTRTSDDTAEAALTGAPTEAWTSPALDGAVYGEPLIFDSQVLVATENDTVYALSAANGAVQWSDHLGTAVPSSALPCGDISPTVGVTSTMVIDSASRTLFASATLWNGTAVSHVLFAINLATHAVSWSRDLDQTGWSAAAQLQRAGLALDDSQVLVSFGGNYGDCGDYHGWVIAVPESGAGTLGVYKVPTANEGAIWAPPGPAVDSSGDVFVATGNGSAMPGQAFDHGDAVIELSRALAEMQYFAPSNWAQDNTHDLDLGSTSPVLLGNGLLFMVGKQATGYLLHTSSLGGVGGPAATIDLCNSRGATAAAGSDLFVVCTDQGTIDEVTVSTAGTLGRGWTWTSPTGHTSSATVARGSLWAVDNDAGVLYGIDPATGTTSYRLPLDVGTPPHFVGVSAGEGLLVVGGSSAVEAFR